MNMSNIWFTGDTHFGHRNILKYCKRPFDSIKDHDSILIQNWNSVVQPGDTVYHLGDFALAPKEYVEKILRRLMGNIVFIRGNHDRVMQAWVKKYLTEVAPLYEIKVQDEEMDLKQNIVLCHYAMQVWNKSHHGSWHLHGHSHGTLPSAPHQARLDVGVDVHRYYPISYEDVKYHMTKKVFKPVDHHGSKEPVDHHPV